MLIVLLIFCLFFLQLVRSDTAISATSLLCCDSTHKEGDSDSSGGFWRCSGPKPIDGRAACTWFVGCDASHIEGAYVVEIEDGRGGYWHCSGPQPCDKSVKPYTWIRFCCNCHRHGEPANPKDDSIWYCTGLKPIVDAPPFVWLRIGFTSPAPTCNLLHGEGDPACADNHGCKFPYAVWHCFDDGNWRLDCNTTFKEGDKDPVSGKRYLCNKSAHTWELK